LANRSSSAGPFNDENDEMMTPSAELRRTHCTRRASLPAGLDARAYGLAGCFARWSCAARRLRARTQEIDGRVGQLREISDGVLDGRIETARRAMQGRHAGAGEIAQALAVVAEAARRECGIRAHPEQIMAALAVHRGALIEMATGEGKTLAVGLAAALAGWARKPCHVFTANDYLAARDSDWLRGFYNRCKLSAGCCTTCGMGARRPPRRLSSAASTPPSWTRRTARSSMRPRRR
jgi:preprotein translocase subunit SecA